MVDLDPQKRLSREALQEMQKHFSEFTVENLSSLFVVYTDNQKRTFFDAYGIDWYLLGIAQAYLEDIRAQMLEESSGESGED